MKLIVYAKRAIKSGRRVILTTIIGIRELNRRCKSLQNSYKHFSYFTLDTLIKRKEELLVLKNNNLPSYLNYDYSSIADDIYIIDLVIKSKHYKK